ncbi:MAG: hypothetical protein NVS4B11_14110 [Ktedonobacteraceae bacterium]
MFTIKLLARESAILRCNIMQLLSYPRQSLANLSTIDRRNPGRLFDEAIQDFGEVQFVFAPMS